MAEIHIERKRGNALMWVIPGLIVLALLWWFMRGGDRNEAATVVTDSTAYVRDTVTAAGDVARDSAGGTDEFVRFVGVREPNRDLAGHHAYIAGGVRRLATALAAMTTSSGAADKLAEMRRNADALESSAVESDRHADMARQAFLAAADVFAMLPGSQTAAVDVAAVRTAADAVKPRSQLLEQEDKVDSFFDAASRALQAAKRGA